jgi:hypothetical protein
MVNVKKRNNCTLWIVFTSNKVNLLCLETYFISWNETHISTPPLIKLAQAVPIPDLYSVQITVTLNKDFCGFHQFLQANSGIIILTMFIVVRITYRH